MALIELIIIIAILFIALLLCVLLIPFYLSFSFIKKGHDIRTEFEVSWLGGLVGKKLEEKKTEKPEKEKVEKPEKEGKNITDQLGDVYDLIEYTPDFLELFHPFLKFIKDSLFSLKIREIKLRVKAGFVEPQYTGYLAGCLYFARGLTYMMPMNPDIVIEPDFNVPHDAGEMKLDIYLKTVLGVRLINFAVPLIRFILSKPARRLMWTGKKAYVAVYR